MPDQLSQLISGIQSGAHTSLSPFEYFLIKDYLKSFNPLLKEYENGVENLRASTPIGDSFLYRGQRYMVGKLRAQTDYHKAYDLALSHIPEELRSIIADTVVEEFTKEVKKAEPVY
jgi:hypothetical protein